MNSLIYDKRVFLFMAKFYLQMDTIRLKFKRPLPSNSPYFIEKIKGKDAWTNNAWRKERQRSGLYVPKYWIEADFMDPNTTYLYFELSLPKMLFKNNLTELQEKNFEEVVSLIADFSRQIGIPVLSEEIRVAKPTILAIGKNISLTNICSCDLALKTLAMFDYKPYAEHRIVAFNDCKAKGKEIHFNIQKTETTKFYDKKKEIINNAETAEEKTLAVGFNRPDCVVEILRVERTFKTKRKIAEKFGPYLRGKEPTFENLFNMEMCSSLLKDEVRKILDHPFANFLFLALEQRPLIEAILDKSFSHIQTRDTVMGLIMDLQELGLAGTRQKYLEGFRSRQTWYNYKKRLKIISKRIDWQQLSYLDSFRIYKYILKQFGIDNSYQLELDFQTGLSKKVGAQPRNTGGGRHD